MSLKAIKERHDNDDAAGMPEDNVAMHIDRAQLIAWVEKLLPYASGFGGKPWDQKAAALLREIEGAP